MEKVIEVKNLTKEYKEQKAVYHLMYMKEKYQDYLDLTEVVKVQL